MEQGKNRSQIRLDLSVSHPPADICGRCDVLTGLLEYLDHLYRIALATRLLKLTNFNLGQH
jgi:hypothetical protein